MVQLPLVQFAHSACSWYCSSFPLARKIELMILGTLMHVHCKVRFVVTCHGGTIGAESRSPTPQTKSSSICLRSDSSDNNFPLEGSKLWDSDPPGFQPVTSVSLPEQVSPLFTHVIVSVRQGFAEAARLGARFKVHGLGFLVPLNLNTPYRRLDKKSLARLGVWWWAISSGDGD